MKPRVRLLSDGTALRMYRHAFGGSFAIGPYECVNDAASAPSNFFEAGRDLEEDRLSRALRIAREAFPNPVEPIETIPSMGGLRRKYLDRLVSDGKLIKKGRAYYALAKD